jgi:hypothetical protein
MVIVVNCSQLDSEEATMPAIDQVTALLDSAVSLDDLDRLTPAQLHRFSELCWHWHSLASARVKARADAARTRLPTVRNGAGEHAR